MNYGGLFDPDNKQKRVAELEVIMQSSDFWNDKKKSETTIVELNSLKASLDNVKKIRDDVENNIETLEMLKEDYDKDIFDLINNDANSIGDNLANLEVQLLLDEPYDGNNAILEIHPGAGGTESCDWAAMLYRLYTRWSEQNGYKLEVIDEQAGEEAGIKNVSIIIKGKNAYGYLKNEKGVHRLIRISPFDSNSRRHTSFASVDVTPLFDNNEIKIELKDSDLKIDVYRSTGAGGQSVNTTDSAVRITHLPTKIVVTCQNERSQIQNREKALEILKNKIYQLEIEKRESELKSFKGENIDINFGSQIRSYVMHPYSMVKDHRTNVETSNVNKVLDGDIKMFINANLKRGSK
jgi:peptide chain release factor 2